MNMAIVFLFRTVNGEIVVTSSILAPKQTSARTVTFCLGITDEGTFALSWLEWSKILIVFRITSF